MTLSKVTSACPRGSCFLFLREALEGTKINPCHSQEHEAAPALGWGGCFLHSSFFKQQQQKGNMRGTCPFYSPVERGAVRGGGNCPPQRSAASLALLLVHLGTFAVRGFSTVVCTSRGQALPSQLQVLFPTASRHSRPQSAR